MKHKLLGDLNACGEAVRWAEQFESIEEAWNKCHRGDWMLWLAAKIKVGRKLFLAKGLCANTVRHLMKDQRSKDAVDAAIGYGRGKVTKAELSTYAAYAAYAYAAADAYAAAAAAADAYAAAAAAADAYAARARNQQETADICREVLTDVVFKKIKAWRKKHDEK